MKRDIEKLEKVQCRAASQHLGVLPHPRTLLLLDLPTLAYILYRRFRGDLIQVLKIVHRIQDVERTSLFIMSTYVEGLRGHDMRLSEQGRQTRVRQNCSQRLTSVQCLEHSGQWGQTPTLFILPPPFL